MQLQKSTTSQALNGLYHVESASEREYKLIPKRRGPIRPIPGLTMHDANEMKLRAFEHAGLDDFNACWTFEPLRRPIPFVATDPKPARALEKFKRYGRVVLDFLLPHVTAHTQSYNKISSAGYPINSNPKNFSTTQEICQRIGLEAPTASNKFDLLLPLFRELDAADDSRYKDSFSTLGGRLQYEAPDKKRDFLFINDDGVIYEHGVTREDRTQYIEELDGDYVGSRYRGVVNPAVINLYIQNWDTMLHGAIMKFPLCESNVYTRIKWAHSSEFTTFDCKHFERYMGMIVFEYANLIGGLYGAWLTKLASDPYLVISDSKKSAFKIRPIYKKGQYPQFGSGISCVSTLGKLTNIVVQVGYFVDTYHMPPEEAIRVVMAGEHDGLRRWSYGDDNRLMGSADKRKSFTDYLGQHFDVEVDDHPVYLGTIYRSDLDSFVLPARTYNLKLYLRERDYDWYTYPALGNYERRKTFMEYGEPEITKDIIPYEDQLFEDVGLPYHIMVAQAIKEKKQMLAHHESLTNEELTDKEYLLTPEEQVESGSFWGLPPSETRRIVLNIVSTEIKTKLRL
jgi:hypothetical protein